MQSGTTLAACAAPQLDAALRLQPRGVALLVHGARESSSGRRPVLQRAKTKISALGWRKNGAKTAVSGSPGDCRNVIAVWELHLCPAIDFSVIISPCLTDLLTITQGGSVFPSVHWPQRIWAPTSRDPSCWELPAPPSVELASGSLLHRGMRNSLPQKVPKPPCPCLEAVWEWWSRCYLRKQKIAGERSEIMLCHSTEGNGQGKCRARSSLLPDGSLVAAENKVNAGFPQN